jgi:hypothetical protein
VDARPFVKALGDFQKYFDTTIKQFKVDATSQFSATSIAVNKLQRESEYSFKFKGNKVQYSFNCEILEKIKEVSQVANIPNSATVLLDDIEAQIKKRNKLIRIADKSDAGWGAVEEYLSDDLASDSEDERKIRAAQTRANRKRKPRKGQSQVRGRKAAKRPSFYEPPAATYPNPDSFFSWPVLKQQIRFGAHQLQGPPSRGYVFRLLQIWALEKQLP